MMHTIKTENARVTIQPSPRKPGYVMVTLHPQYWPPVFMDLLPTEAAVISDALGLTAQACEA